MFNPADYLTQLLTQLRALLGRLRAEGARIAAYGAPAKGNTLLNYCGIGTELVEYTVDRNPLKQDRYLPGQHQPVLHPDVLLERQPDYLLILAWNFADEIVRLYRDPELWLRLSDAGLANIESHFSFDAASRALQRILRG